MPSFTQLTPTSPVGSALGDLRSSGVVLDAAPATRVTSVTVDHRQVQRGSLFAALPGHVGHGASHAREAAVAGATAVLTDPAGRDVARQTGLPTLVAPDPRAVLGDISAAVYDTVRQHPSLLGVTGTNGKTTTVHLIDALLVQLGIPSGRSSTVDRRSGDTTVASRLTTPEAPELHALIARMKEDGVAVASLEVSAQALTRHRVDGIRFDVAGFTNLSHDHRDDYPTEGEYLAAKVALFQPARARRGVVLLDTPAGQRVRDRAGIPVTTVSSVEGVDADWRVRVTSASPTTTEISLAGPHGRRLVTSIPLLGRHMAADCALSVVMLTEAGIDFAEIAHRVRGGVDVTVPGRSDLVSGARGPRVYLDFSHTPDSIEKTLAALRAVAEGRVIAILGADGDRDPSKRPLMGRAAAAGADAVIVTDHHPRFEDPAAIRRALVLGAESQPGHPPVEEIADPSVAIRHALAIADEHDTVLWVGPGQTDYRVVGDRDVPYSPRADARLALAEAGW
jgi:UDP-N-acetylmuramoyl-L-alanyl-D-glutamate--2,6-diaminopimelate ligase